MLVCVFFGSSHQVSPLLSCAAGFAGGFFIPPSRMKIYFKWLMYINPSYYGYAGMLRTVLPTVKSECDYESTIECFPSTGEYWIEDFGMNNVQPYLSLLILFVMTFFIFVMAWVAIEIRISNRGWASVLSGHGLFRRLRNRSVHTEMELTCFANTQDTSDSSVEADGGVDFPDGGGFVVQSNENRGETLDDVRNRVAEDTFKRWKKMKECIENFDFDDNEIIV
jgi:hypothetical protein